MPPLRPPCIKLSSRVVQPVRSPAQRSASSQKRTIYGYTQSKALTYSQHGDPSTVLNLHSHSLSAPHGSLVTARLLVSPINPADINTIQGVYPSKPPFTTSLGTAEPSAVPGNEGLAEVTSTGSDATITNGDGSRTKLRKGDWLLFPRPGMGTWRTALQADASSFTHLSPEVREGISRVQAATVSVNPCTAYAMLKGYIGAGTPSGERLQEGAWFAQNGANSGVGRAAVQLGKAWGLRSINFIRERPGGAGETRKLKDELRALGADAVYTDGEAAEKGFAARVKEECLNGGREQVRLALNCVGGKSSLALQKILADGGWHVTYGAMAKQPVSVPAGLLIFKAQRYAGFWVSEWSRNNVEAKRKAVEEVFELIRRGQFKDTPVREVGWDWNTERDELVNEVQGTLEGYRDGKGVFVFGEMPE